MSGTRTVIAPDFKLLFEASPGLYLVLAPDLTILGASDDYLRATMTRREQIVGRDLFEIFPDNPDDPTATGVANLRASLGRVLAERRPDAMAVQKYDIRVPEEAGGGFEERLWSPVNSPVLGHDGGILYVIHRVEDVTEFVRLRQQGSEQAKIADELRTRTGRMETEIFQRAQQIQEANRQLRELQAELELRVQARTSDLLAANSELQRHIAEHQAMEVALRHSEVQLRQSQKLEAIGRLAGGVAHDFNNLLSVILSYCQLLLAELGPEDSKRAELEEIQLAGNRAAELTRQLSAFSRQQVLDPKLLDPNEILRNVTKILRRVLGEDVELRLALEPQLGRVIADRGQVEQVLMNLVVNARDAMPRGGKLTIETANAELDGSYVGAHIGVKPGPYVLIAVSDTGVGMDKATQARVFEPFFTTKEYGKGTGLGLSTVYGIVQQSGGSIWLYSEPGAGATFKIYLPRAEGIAEVARPPAIPTQNQRGTETILLVEDEDQVRAVLISILRMPGYQVLEARTPAEAMRIVETHSGRIDLLLTDVVMPGMNGRELAERVLTMREGLRVLFMSGYTDDVVLHHGVLQAGVPFLQKPITPDSLSRKVRQVLDADRVA